MKILVTGGSGFIGAYVIEAAEIAGHEVESFDRRDGNDILGDLATFADFDRVIHLAGVLGTAELFDDAEHAVTVNTVGTLRVLQACEQYGLGYVGITMPPVFPSVYTATKIARDPVGDGVAPLERCAGVARARVQRVRTRASPRGRPSAKDCAHVRDERVARGTTADLGGRHPNR